MEAKRPSISSDSDKDSGFSDDSLDYLSSAEPTSSEDAWRALRQISAGAFTPVVVMKNTVVRQGGNSSQFQSWTLQPSWKTVPTHQRLVVLHPPVPSVPLEATREKKGSSHLQPILDSYAKIALQPYKRGLEDREESSMQKRLCTRRTDTSPNQVSPLPSGVCLQGPLALRPSWKFLWQDVPIRNTAALPGFQLSSDSVSEALGCAPASCLPASPASESQAVAQSALCNPLVLGKQLSSASDLPSQQPSKNRRFQNTMVVLHKSGLLDITMKTKKLISQNLVTQVELDQLKQQTQLFMKALQNNAPQVWAELEASLRQSNKTMNSLLTSPDI